MLRNRCIPGAIVLASAVACDAHAEAIKFVRDPHIANDGRLTFAYHGDIWVADADGSNARRLTAHVASDSSPRFSPDGVQIAFSSNRMGNDDVWMMSATGSEPRQLTFNTTGDNVLGLAGSFLTVEGTYMGADSFGASPNERLDLTDFTGFIGITLDFI